MAIKFGASNFQNMGSFGTSGSGGDNGGAQQEELRTPSVSFDDLGSEEQNVYMDEFYNVYDEEKDNKLEATFAAEDKLFSWQASKRDSVADLAAPLGIGFVPGDRLTSTAEGQAQINKETTPSIIFDNLNGEDQKVYMDAYYSVYDEQKDNKPEATFAAENAIRAKYVNLTDNLIDDDTLDTLMGWEPGTAGNLTEDTKAAMRLVWQEYGKNGLDKYMNGGTVEDRKWAPQNSRWREAEQMIGPAHGAQVRAEAGISDDWQTLGIPQKADRYMSPENALDQMYTLLDPEYEESGVTPTWDTLQDKLESIDDPALRDEVSIAYNNMRWAMDQGGTASREDLEQAYTALDNLQQYNAEESVSGADIPQKADRMQGMTPDDALERMYETLGGLSEDWHEVHQIEDEDLRTAVGSAIVALQNGQKYGMDQEQLESAYSTLHMLEDYEARRGQVITDYEQNEERISQEAANVFADDGFARAAARIGFTEDDYKSLTDEARAEAQEIYRKDGNLDDWYIYDEETGEIREDMLRSTERPQVTWDRTVQEEAQERRDEQSAWFRNNPITKAVEGAAEGIGEAAKAVGSKEFWDNVQTAARTTADIVSPESYAAMYEVAKREYLPGVWKDIKTGAQNYWAGMTGATTNIITTIGEILDGELVMRLTGNGDKKGFLTWGDTGYVKGLRQYSNEQAGIAAGMNKDFSQRLADGVSTIITDLGGDGESAKEAAAFMGTVFAGIFDNLGRMSYDMVFGLMGGAAGALTEMQNIAKAGASGIAALNTGGLISRNARWAAKGLAETMSSPGFISLALSQYGHNVDQMITEKKGVENLTAADYWFCLADGLYNSLIELGGEGGAQGLLTGKNTGRNFWTRQLKAVGQENLEEIGQGWEYKIFSNFRDVANGGTPEYSLFSVEDKDAIFSVAGTLDTIMQTSLQTLGMNAVYGAGGSITNIMHKVQRGEQLNEQETELALTAMAIAKQGTEAQQNPTEAQQHTAFDSAVQETAPAPNRETPREAEARQAETAAEAITQPAAVPAPQAPTPDMTGRETARTAEEQQEAEAAQAALARLQAESEQAAPERQIPTPEETGRETAREQEAAQLRQEEARQAEQEAQTEQTQPERRIPTPEQTGRGTIREQLDQMQREREAQRQTQPVITRQAPTPDMTGRPTTREQLEEQLQAERQIAEARAEALRRAGTPEEVVQQMLDQNEQAQEAQRRTFEAQQELERRQQAIDRAGTDPKAQREEQRRQAEEDKQRRKEEKQRKKEEKRKERAKSAREERDQQRKDDEQRRKENYELHAEADALKGKHGKRNSRAAEYWKGVNDAIDTADDMSGKTDTELLVAQRYLSDYRQKYSHGKNDQAIRDRYEELGKEIFRRQVESQNPFATEEESAAVAQAENIIAGRPDRQSPTTFQKETARAREEQQRQEEEARQSALDRIRNESQETGDGKLDQEISPEVPAEAEREDGNRRADEEITSEVPEETNANERADEEITPEVPQETNANERAEEEVASEVPEETSTNERAAEEVAPEPPAETPADQRANEEIASEPPAETPADQRANEEIASEPPAETPQDQKANEEIVSEPPAETPQDQKANEEIISEPPAETANAENAKLEQDLAAEAPKSEQKVNNPFRELQENGRKVARQMGFAQYSQGSRDTGVQISSWSGSMSADQQAELRIVDDLTRSLGITAVVDSTAAQAGAEGFYNRNEKEGTVLHLMQDGKNPLRVTLGHEAYHMLENLNPQAAATVRSIFEKYAEKSGTSIDNLINEKMETYRKMGIQIKGTEAQIREYFRAEVVADSLYDIIGDTASVRALAVRDRGLVERIRDWVGQMMNRLRKMTDRYASNSREARILRDNIGAMEEARNALILGLGESEALARSRKAAESLGTNGPMLEEYHHSMDSADSRQAMNAATLRLAEKTLKAVGEEATAENVDRLMYAAMAAESGSMPIGEAWKALGYGAWKNDAEANRAFRSLGRYVNDMLSSGDQAGFDQLFGYDAQVQQEADDKWQQDTAEDIRYSLTPTEDERIQQELEQAILDNDIEKQRELLEQARKLDEGREEKLWPDFDGKQEVDAQKALAEFYARQNAESARYQSRRRAEDSADFSAFMDERIADTENQLMLETDMAGGNRTAWNLLETMRDHKMRVTQNADGQTESQKGYWRKDVEAIARKLQDELGPEQKTGDYKKRVSEMFKRLDDYDGDIQGFFNYALKEAQDLTQEIMTEQLRAGYTGGMEDTQWDTKAALREIFKGRYLYVGSEEAQALINTYYGGMREFSKQMSAAGIRVTKNSHTRGVLDLQDYWHEVDPNAVGAREQADNLMRMLGGEENESVTSMIEKLYDAATTIGQDSGVQLSSEEIDAANIVALDTLAEYMQAGDKVVRTRSVEKIDAEHHQETVRERDELRAQTQRQETELQDKEREIGRLEDKMETLERVNLTNVKRMQEQRAEMARIREEGVNAQELKDAQQKFVELTQEHNQNLKELKKTQKALEAARQKATDLRAQAREALAKETMAERRADVANRRAERLMEQKARLEQEYREKYKTRMEAQRARAERAQKRSKGISDIRKTGMELRRMLEHPDKNKGFIPIDHARDVAELTEALLTNDGRKSAAKISRHLQNVIEEARRSNDYATGSMYQEETAEAMREVSKLLEDKGALRNLSDDEVNIVSTTLKTVAHQMKTASQTIGREQNVALAEEAADGIRVMNRHKQKMTGLGALMRKGVLQHLNPQRFFDMVGHHGNNAITRMGEELSAAQRKDEMHRMKMTQYFEPLITGENEKLYDRFTGKNAVWYDTGVQVIDDRGQDTGRTFRMNGGMRAMFSMMWENEENREAMKAPVTQDGQQLYQLTMPDEELMKKGKNKEAIAHGERMYFTESQARAIVDELTDYERSWMSAWRAMEKYSKEEINKTSLALFGYHKATVDNYVPIFRDPAYIGKDFDSVVMDNRLTSMGFLKERVNAHNPVMLLDLNNVVDRQITNVADFCGLAIAVRNATRIYNSSMQGYATSFKQTMNQTQGTEVTRYFEKMMGDIQGMNRTESGVLDKLRSNLAGAALTFSPTVTVKQAASYPAAASVIGWKPLMQAFKYFNPVEYKKINENTEIHPYSAGFWLRGSNSRADLEANAARSRLGKTAHWLGNTIQGMDKVTTKVLFKACEYYVRDNRTDLKAGTEAFRQEVARVYDQVLEETQPEYGVMQRPGVLRSNSNLTKSLTMFKTQSFQNFGILADAVTGFMDARQAAREMNSEENQAAVKQAQTKLANAVSSQIASAVILGVMTALGKALMHKMKGYRDDKGDLTAESVGAQIMRDSASSVAGMVVGGSELFDLVSGLIQGQSPFDIEAAGISTVNDLYQNTYSLLSAAQVLADKDLTDQEKLERFWPKLRKMGLSVAQLFGFPAGNIMNLVDGIAANAADFVKGTPGQFVQPSPIQINGMPIIGNAQGRETSNKAVAGYIAQAMMDGNQAEATRLYNEQLRQGKSAESLNTAIATWQKENIPEIREAAEAIEGGDLDRYNSLIQEMTGMGLSMTNAVKYVESERKKMKAKEPAKQAYTPMTYDQITAGMTKEESKTSYTNGMMNSLLESGNIEDALQVRGAMIASGKTMSTIKSSLTSYWKPLIVQAYEDGDIAYVREMTEMLVKMGMNRDTVSGWTKGKSSSKSTTTYSFGKTTFGATGFNSTKNYYSSKSYKKRTKSTSNFGKSGTFGSGGGFGSGGFGK